MFDICMYGDPVLRKRAVEVECFDDELRQFVEEMVVTMKARDGVGLAAPQVNHSRRIVVIDPTNGEEPTLVFINPRITRFSDDLVDFEEGCLSVPDIRMNVKRPSIVSVSAQDLKGNEFQIDNTEKLLARALQHEIDHLDGILFVDRVSPVARQLVNGKLKKMAKAHRKKRS